MKKLSTSLILLYLVQMSFAMPKYTLEAVSDGYQVKLEIPELLFREERVTRKLRSGTIVNETFYRISIPGFANTAEKGKPELMQSAFKLAIEGEVPCIEISDLIEERITLTHKIYPSQGPVWYPTPKKEESFYIDEDYYNSEGVKSSYVSLSSSFIIRGQKGISVLFNPVKYNPKENILTVAKSFTVKFKMKKPVQVKSMDSRLYDKYIRRIFQNLRGELGASVRSNEFRQKEDYLIIAGDRFVNNEDLKRFIEFRQQSYNVELALISDAGSSKEEITEFIKGKLPTFVIFVGMFTDFPYYIGEEQAGGNWIFTYLYYTTVVGNDNKPDVSLGLFFVRNMQSLTNLVNKTIHTETHLEEMGDGYLCWAGNTEPLGPLAAEHIEVLFNELEDDYFVSGGFDIKKVYCVTSPIGSPSDALNYMNEGLRFFNYNGHGFDRGWSYPGAQWSTSSTPGQINNTVYPFTFSMSCLTGNFAYGADCWAEHWIGHEKLGTTFIGASQNSSIQQHGMNRGFGIAIVEEDITKMGLIHDYAKEYMYDSITIQNYAAIGAEEYHLFGDPAVETMKEENTPIFTKITNVPTNLSLSNITTKTMNISIPVRGVYTISAYSVNGRLINTFRDNFSAGTHIIRWNHTNTDIGSQLLLIAIKSNDRKYTAKAVLQR